MQKHFVRAAQPRELVGQGEPAFVGHAGNAIRSDLRPRTHAASLQGISPRDLLVDMVDDAMRQMRAAASGLSRRDHDRMKQFGNGQYLSGVFHIVEIGQKCEELAAATAFAEAIRGFTVQHHPKARVGISEAFGAETHANGIANDAQHAYWADPTEANKYRAIEALNYQLVETYRALNALHGARR